MPSLWRHFFLRYMKSLVFAFIVYLRFNLFQMSIRRIVVAFLILPISIIAQNSQQWQGYFSYNRITDVSESPSSIIASSENAVFSKNLINQSIATTNSVNGLKAEVITAVYHSPTLNFTFVGNSNGLMLIIRNDGSIVQRRGILEEVPVSPLIKRINHFLEYNGKLYISCDYGISVFDFATFEFGDTYYIGNAGTTVKIYQTVIFNNEIYAVTDNQGIKKALLSNPNLVDFSQWLVFAGGGWNGIAVVNNVLLGSGLDQRIYKIGVSDLVLLPQLAIDMRSYNNFLIITTPNHVYVYNPNLIQVAHVQTNQVNGDPVTFSCATLINDILYIGTNERGILSSPLTNPTNFNEIKPDGPILNHIFRVRKSSTTLWTLYGRYNRTYNPYNLEPPFGSFNYPLSKYTTTNGWGIIPYNSLFQAKSLSNIAFVPGNDNNFFISSYISGVVKVVNETPTVLLTQANTQPGGLETGNGDIRTNGPVFDKNGNMWVTVNYLAKPLKVMRPNGSWQSFDFTGIIPETFNECYAVPAVDKNSTVWMPTSRNGLIAFNNEVGNRSMVFKAQSEGNLPDIDVRCVAIDNRNQIWIGTSKGLRYIQNVDQFLSEDNIQTKAIIIEEEINGEVLAQELFYDQFILDIAVDGANRKWVSIASSGVYLVSPNGQLTLYHFTKENSPLPSNNVNDIEIDGITGEVYFATDKGLVSFKGVATKPSENLENAYVYPNPVRPNFNGTVKISGLTDKANVKITDIEGNLVYETTSAGGTIEWDTTAFGKYRVASGVYMVFLATQDGMDTNVKKVMIIR